MTLVDAIAFLDRHRHFLTLALVCLAAAGVFAWGAAGYAQRDQLETFARSACASVSSQYAGVTRAKDPADRRDGVVCINRIAELQRAVSASHQVAAQQLGDAVDERAGKAANDDRARRGDEARARAAAKQMEAADAAVQDDRVGADWFDALNRSAGLQPGS